MKLARRAPFAVLVAILLLFATFVPPLSAAVPPDSRATTSPAAFSCDNVTEIPKSECEALVALYQKTAGSKWIDNTGWTQSEKPCSWFGVKCNNGQVTELQFGEYPQGNGLQGVIPTELAALAALRILNLDYNKLTGPIPLELTSLENLRALSIQQNQLVGEIASELGGLSNLEVLALGGNHLTGSIPATLGGLNNLWKLELWGNDLNGSIPVELANLKALVFLYLGGNNLTGSIPPPVAALPRLMGLDLKNNQLSGPIPLLPSPDYIYLGNNQLSGEIPADLVKRSRHTVDLGGNRLTGQIPSDWGQYPQYTLYFFVDNNLLTGPLPSGMTNLERLERLTYDNTDLCAPTDVKFQTWLSTVKVVRGTGVTCGAQTVTGLVWNDANRNGAQDSGEAGLAGATVTLTQTQTATAVDAAGRRVFTDKDGRYRFDYVATGAHTVSVAKPGFLPTSSATIPINVPEGGLTVPPVGIAWAPAHIFLPLTRR